MSGKGKAKTMFKIKSASIIVLILLAAFGLQQALRSHATANYTDIFIKSENQANNRPAHFLSPDKDALYEEKCATCHFLYRPGLLPTLSWVRLIEESGNHFGEKLKLSHFEKRALLSYLTKNSADEGWKNVSHEKGKTALILFDEDMELNNNTPIRVTETGYMKEAHKNIPPEVFNRETVGGFNNCGACHTRP
ncbi:MAG: hypothetical protein V3V95_00415 [Thermodesulfobacteriota bacterium]